MKNPRKRSDEDEGEKVAGNSGKEVTFGAVKYVYLLIVFIAGVVLGLTASVRVTCSIPSPPLFLPNVTTKSASVCEENNLSVKDFISPRKLSHYMKDDELFWRASMTPKKKEYPFKRVPKVAFLFLTRGDLPLTTLWERFFHGHEDLYTIYVHSPPDYVLNVSESSPFYGRRVPSKEVHWGMISLVDAERRLLANALLDFSNERFVLLSESCIPIYNFTTVYEYLISSHQSFVNSYDLNTRDGRGRYSRDMLPDIKLSHWRKGSQWFELNRHLASFIVSDTKYYNIFKKHCLPVCYPDEHYLPTYIHMFHGALNSNRSLTWVDWSKGGPHPVTFQGSQITEKFISFLRNNGTECSHNSMKTPVCYLFARKFAPSALEPLLNLSLTLIKF